MMIPIGKGQSTYKYPQARSSNGVYLAFNLKLYGKAKISTAWHKVVGIASRKKGEMHGENQENATANNHHQNLEERGHWRS